MFFFSLFCGGSKYTQLNWAFCHQFKTSDERINGNSKTETENGNYQKGISGNLRLSKKKNTMGVTFIRKLSSITDR